MNNKISINTHHYDKIIGPIYKNYFELDNELLQEPISFVNTVAEIRAEIKKGPNNSIKAFANKAINVIDSNNNKNYDDLNEIHVHDLLGRTWRFIREYDDDSRGFFIEQLAEIITGGSCSQGRTTRIFQFYEFHMREKDKIFNKCKK